MVSFKYNSAPHCDDLDARCARIHGKLLDGIEDMLDELAQPATQRATIENAVWAQVAPLFCGRATCRRARRCRRQPCNVTAAAAR